MALRRAIVLAFDNAEEVRLVLRGQAAPAHGMIPPHCWGHDPALRSEMGSPSAARAQALLDLHGYTDRNADGWREQPDGRPLVLRLAFTPDRRSRAASELWLKRLKAVGLRVQFEFAPFGELIKRSLAGQLMMWGFTGRPATPTATSSSAWPTAPTPTRATTHASGCLPSTASTSASACCPTGPSGWR